MRPPRIAILVLFLATSLFLFCRSIGALAAPSPSSHSSNGVTSRQPSSPRPYLSGLLTFNSPFSLFPPSAAITLTDDNSTTFAARPAAFGPLLSSLGLTGQLWVGGGFNEDDAALQDGGELGCADAPGWEDGRSPHSLSSPSSSLFSSGSSSSGGTDLTSRRRRKRHVPPSSPLYTRAEAASGLDGLDDHVNVGTRAKVRATDDGTDDDLDDHDSYAHTTGRGVGRAVHADIQFIQESAEIAGKVVLLSRGGCGFAWKVRWAQRRGAKAVIIGDSQKGGSLIQMFAKGDTSDISVPSVFTSRMTALALSSLSQPGSGPASDAARGRPSRSWLSRLFAGGDDSDDGGGSASPLAWFFMGSKGTAGHSGHAAGIDTTTSSTPLPTPAQPPSATQHREGGLLAKLFGTAKGSKAPADGQEEPDSSSSSPSSSSPSYGDGVEEDEEFLDGHIVLASSAHKGLWVTLTPTNSASPFFDTLLVLVVSPLMTLVVVYALLIIRARIRRQSWRAPKSVIDQLPVRTYHTVAASPTDSPRLPSATASSSPTTPLLQAAPSPPASIRGGLGGNEADDGGARSGGSDGNDETNAASTSGQISGYGSTSGPTPIFVSAAMPSSAAPSSPSRPRSRTTVEGSPKVEKRQSEWHKYMNRQVECVVCLEEYIDGVSQVMSLPCGHEFHAECITPWLTMRRRTCPICKGDVVRSLAQGSSSSEPTYIPYQGGGDDYDDDDDDGGHRGTRPLHIGFGSNALGDLEHGPYGTPPSLRGHRPSRSEGWVGGGHLPGGYDPLALTRPPPGADNRGRRW